jgi:hypothetical protein
MKRAWLPAILAAATVASLLPALAAELGEADQRYLRAEYGIGPHDATVAGLSADQQKQLHGIINDPQLAPVPQVRHDRVAAFLYDVHMRQCQGSATSHPGVVCPPVADQKVEPGKELADQQCNFCHLFGAGHAPAFATLAQQQAWTGDALAEAQRHGHETARRTGLQMSPVALTGEQFDALAVYIGSLK